ncbi:response regulator transcription factor [Pontibacter ruber]|uniref:Response regulator transcription factor n=1 Tax=Pontibacter ruber TaxID=1343895 RepID=A0ABW5D1H1_9BACT|nr:helix-turn-helix transcriptional regulator [Pontibacter ruber]
MTRNLKQLTNKECRVIALLADGLTNGQIGERFSWSENQVEQCHQKMLRKLGFSHSYQLISWAYREGILK